LKPLVTVIVATYNSAPYVLETLESAYNQTYTNLGLIVSDDCSTDETLAIVKEWLAQDKVKNRFQSIQLLTVQKNTGISANCNRSIAATKSDYFKFIAGDDILYPNCIQDNMNFVLENPNARIVFSQINLYQDQFEDANYIKTTPQDFPLNIMDSALSAQDQYNLLLLSDRIHYTPSFFTHKQTIIDVGGYDENNKLVEDYPMWLKLTKAGIRLDYFHKVTVGYRIHSRATNNISNSVLFKPAIFNSFKIRKQLAHPYLPWEIAASEYHIYLVSRVFSLLNWNKKTKIFASIYKFWCVYFNPFQYVYSLKKRLQKSNNTIFYL
jgi:glycosyltransferase involved in cell wall biosynthesis